MPLSQNVSGVIKQYTKLTQNVSGVLKNYTSLKQNVSGVLKELLPQIIAAFTLVTTSGSNTGSSSNPSVVNAESGWSYTFKVSQAATGVTGLSYFSNLTIQSFSPKKACTLKVAGTYSGSGSISVKINGTELVSSSPVSITKSLTTSDTVTITGSASWGYVTAGACDMTISLT